MEYMSGIRRNPFSTVYKRCNSGNNVEKYHDMRDFPDYLDIELTNLCNFHCIFCHTGLKQLTRQKGYMSDEIFHKIIAEIEPHKTPVRFIGWGEPTLHPHLFRYLKICVDNGIMTHINTNGYLLTPAMMEEFINIPLNSIKFSFQGVDDVTYQAMRGRAFFSDLKDKIHHLYDMRGEREYPFIQVSTTTTWEPEESVHQFISDFRQISDYVNVGKTLMCHIDPSMLKLPASLKERLRKIQVQESLIKTRFSQCPEIFNKLSIHYDGKVSACCNDYDDLLNVGDLMKQTLKEVWYSQKMEEIRLLILDKMYHSLPICSDCFNIMGVGLDE